MVDGRERTEWDRTAATIASVSAMFGSKLNPNDLNPYRRREQVQAVETEDTKEARRRVFMVGLESGLKAFAEDMRRKISGG